MTFEKQLLAAVLTAAFVLAGCGDDSTSADAGSDAAPDGAADTGTADTGATDTGTADTGAADTGGPDASTACSTGCGIVELALGASHSCARRENGQVLCWGNNEDRELGDGVTRHSDCSDSGSTLPVDCSPTPVVAAAADVVEMAASGGHSMCVRQSDGTALCWGRTGALRPEDVDPRRLTPEAEPLWSGAVQLSDSQRHTCAILADGSVSCVWQNDGGQLGDGTSMERLTPVAVRDLTGAQELRVSTFPGSFTCARTASDVQCWGANESGQLGDGSATHEMCNDGVTSIDCSTTPVTVTGLTSPIQITAGSDFACAIEDGGTLKCWGANNAGQLGLDRTTTPFASAPTEVTGLSGVSQVVAGANHTCVLLSGGGVKCFGFNEQGELGDGMATGHGDTCDVGSLSGDCSSSPVDVALPSAATFLAAGRRHTCALLDTGAVYCWGLNSRMQLGRADRLPSATPLEISGLD